MAYLLRGWRRLIRVFCLAGALIASLEGALMKWFGAGWLVRMVGVYRARAGAPAARSVLDGCQGVATPGHSTGEPPLGSSSTPAVRP